MTFLGALLILNYMADDDLDFDLDTMQPTPRLPQHTEPPAPRSTRRPNIKQCGDCGGDVSTFADFCPHCGSRAFDTVHLLGDLGKNLFGLGSLILIGLLFVLLAVCVIAALH